MRTSVTGFSPSGAPSAGPGSGSEEWLNVRLFGAVGDGVHDDADAIDRALAQAQRVGVRNGPKDLTPRGATVYLPPGQYRITRSLALGAYVTLRGSGVMASSLVLAPGVFRRGDSPAPILRVGVDNVASAARRASKARVNSAPRARVGAPGVSAGVKPPGATDGYQLLGLEPGVPDVHILDLSLLGRPDENAGVGGVLWNAGPGSSIERVAIEASVYGIRATGSTGPTCLRDLWILATGAALDVERYGTLWIAGAALSGGIGLRLASVGPITITGCRYSGAAGALRAHDAVCGILGLSASTNSAAPQAALQCSQSTLFAAAIETYGYGLTLADEDPVWVRLAASPTERTRLEAYSGQNSVVAHQDSSTIPLFGKSFARINCGGPALTGWSADRNVENGSARTGEPAARLVGAPLAGPAELYTSAREGACVYRLPIPAGAALVRLHFADSRAVSAGERAFGIRVNGQTRRTGFDIAKESLSSIQALILDLPVTVTDGEVRVELIDENHGKPLISGIELYLLPPVEKSSAEPGGGTATLLESMPFTAELPPSSAPSGGGASADARSAGASGMGVLDDSGPIQRLIDSHDGVREIVLPAGVYLIQSSLTISRTLRIRGAGTNRTFLVGGPAQAPIVRVTGSDVQIENLSIVRPTRGVGVAVSIRGSLGCILRGVSISGELDSGLHVQNSYGTRLEQIDVNCGRAIILDGAVLTSITCSRLSAEAGPAITLRNGSSQLRASGVVSHGLAPLLSIENGHSVLVEGCAAVAVLPQSPSSSAIVPTSGVPAPSGISAAPPTPSGEPTPVWNASAAIIFQGDDPGLCLTHFQAVGFSALLHGPEQTVTSGTKLPSSSPLASTGILAYALYLSPMYAWRRVTLP